MKIGIPREMKILEGRVGLTPEACGLLIEAGHQIFVQHGAGCLSGYDDNDYRSIGCHVVEDAHALYQSAELIVKVKEPVESDLLHLKPHHIVFSFLHLAANKPLVDQLCEIGCTAIAFESVVTEDNQRPILSPMSHIAGKLAIQIGAHLLHQPMGGKGILLGGVGDADKGLVVVVGAGQAGTEAVKLADRMGANVTVFDINEQRLSELKASGERVCTQVSNASTLAEIIVDADLVVGAVLIPDKHAPKLVTEAMVKSMKKGSVIVDIAIDQGGCVETMRPTNYESPTYTRHGVTHFGVTNMPGAVPRTASQALSAVIAPSVLKIADSRAFEHDTIRNAINITQGQIVLPALIEEFA